MKPLHLLLTAGWILILIVVLPGQQTSISMQATTDDGTWLILKETDLANGEYHTRHAETFGKYVQGINAAVLRAIDNVQAHALDGGGYFVGKDSIPTESPVCYDLQLFGQPLIKAPRHTSYCSGATYTAFIEALNLLLPDGGEQLSPKRYEALRMQELDGGRREDLVKFWGYWNADGFGSQYALVQYSSMGKEIRPVQLRPGDFVNISWKKGLGHSVIFLGWILKDGDKKMVYWSSQRATNGYADQVVSLQTIQAIKAVRLTDLAKLFTFAVDQMVTTQVAGDSIAW